MKTTSQEGTVSNTSSAFGQSIQVRINVTTQDGSSPGISNVGVTCSTGEIIWSRTDETGRASVSLPRSNRTQAFGVFAGHRSSDKSRLFWLRETREIAPDVEGPLEWALAYNRLSRVTIHTTSESGIPLPSIPITIRLGYSPGPNDKHYGLFCRLTDAADRSLKVLTGADGSSVLDCVHPDFHLEFISGVGGSQLRPFFTDLQADLSQTVYSARTPGHYKMVVRRHERPEFLITVLNPAGAPVPNAQVRIWVAIQEPLEGIHGTTGSLCETDKNGQGRQHLSAFEFPLAASERRFWAASWHEHYGLGFASGMVGLNNLSSTLTYARECSEVRSDNAVIVRVLDSTTGHPLEGISAYLTTAAFNSFRLTTHKSGADGRLAFLGLSSPPPDWGHTFENLFRYAIELERRVQFEPGITDVEVFPGRPVDLKVRVPQPLR